MRNLKLTVAYDGSAFNGWAIQPDVPTVQGILSETVHRITQETVRLYGAGRTDAGVHALGQVAHFKTRSRIPAENFQRALNSLLPAQIRILKVEEVTAEFHSRWMATGKTYRYRILRAPVCPPFLWQYVYHYPYPLDEAMMERAAPCFEGEHDFSSFARWEAGEKEESRVREIFSSRLARDPERDELVYTVRGRSFLRYMVRKIVGTLLAVGKGAIAPEEIAGIIAARDRSRAGPTAPAEGLYMVEVEYPDRFRALAAAETAQSEKDSV